mgnify:CR=1 FL=1
MMTVPADLADQVETFEEGGMWGFRVTCPGEATYTSPVIYETEAAARTEGANDLYWCLHPTGSA